MARSQAAMLTRLLAIFCFLGVMEVAMADTITLKLRSIGRDQTAAQRPIRVFAEEQWNLEQTAVIVCDAWDYHHCLNAVRRLEEFAPRLDQVLKAARSRGVIVIHSPSDCMSAYADHPARLRATQTPIAANLPPNIVHWCSRLKSEQGGYPIDQSDGGEDDDPKEHAEWAAKLKALGRNPGMPWKKQSDLISIDASKDFISDRGDEVWNILERHGIKNVILTGVHCNMCVLGRPFGLRQMVRHGKRVVLIRDMTDSMYSPKSWPYVDHFTGHDLVLDYVEQNVCPTITSDQFVGGEPFRWKADQRETPKSSHSFARSNTPADLAKHWTSMQTMDVSNALRDAKEPLWFRGAMRVPEQWLAHGPVKLRHYGGGKVQVWLNGHEVQSAGERDRLNYLDFIIPKEHVILNDYNLIVLKVTDPAPGFQSRIDMSLEIPQTKGVGIDNSSWQVRVGNDPQFSNIPLPAKFGIGPNAVLVRED